MFAIIGDYSQYHNQRLVEALHNFIGDLFLVLDVQVELLKVHGLLLMVVIMQLVLCL
jgi:hypothetical protein